MGKAAGVASFNNRSLVHPKVSQINLLDSFLPLALHWISVALVTKASIIASIGPSSLRRKSSPDT